MSNTEKKHKRLGRPPGPLTAMQFEKELAALHRMQEYLTVEEFNAKFKRLLGRFKEGR